MDKVTQPKKLGAAVDKGNKQYLHYYPPYIMGQGPRKEPHIFKGTSCWCKPSFTTDWSKMQTREPYIFIYHKR